MAPESTQSVQRVVSGQTISVPKPGNGEIIAVTSSPGGLLELAFDPSAATASREDNSLVFELDDGSRVVITDFFAVGDESLPDLRLPDGVEVASLDFFEGSDLDMSTAAGAATAPPSGGSDGSGDPLSMTGGVGALGVQATWYWGGTSETGEELEGLDRPSGTFGFSLTTDLGFGSVDNIYEDARPYQHLGSDSLHAGRVNMQIETGPGTSVGAITFSGLPEGAVLWLGDPADGGVALKDNGAGGYTLNAGDFGAPGIFISPPPNSDADFNINVSVDFVRGAITETVNGQLPVVVDAVADRPEDVSSAVEADELAGAAAIGGAEQSRADGWINDEASRGDDFDGDQVSYTARMTVTATFSDYGENDAADQSELHYALVQKPGAGWTCDEAADVVKIYHDADGQALSPVWNEATQSFDYDLRPAGAVGEPVEFFRVPVDNDLILQNGGTLDVPVTLHSPDGYFDANQGDHSIDLVTGAMALESAPADEELSMSNNIAVNFGDAKASLDIDVIDSGLSLKLGWFAEGGALAGEKFSGQQGAAYAPSLYEGATNAGASAKIELSIDNSAAEARSEHISQATFTLDAKAGALHIGGQPIQAGSYDINGTVYEVGLEGGKVTISISGEPVSSLNDLELSFVPGPTFDSKDVPFTYTVTVDSAQSGAQAVFSGSSHIVADAVADMPSGLDIDKSYLDESHSAVAPGGSTEISGSANFSDNDGSERHYVVVTMRDSAWSIDGVGDNSNLLSKNNINEYWNSLADNKLPQDVLLEILTPGGNHGPSDNQQYLLFEAYMDEAGVWQVKAFAADGDGGLKDVTGDLKEAGASFGFDQVSGDLSYSIQVTSPADAASDTSATFYTKGITLEVAGDDEYDYRNNIAGTGDTSTTVAVEVLTGRLSMSLSMAEDSLPNQHNGNTAYDPDDPKIVLVGGAYYGEFIDMDFSGGSKFEYVKSISFDPLPANGAIFYSYTGSDGVQAVLTINAGDSLTYDPVKQTITLTPADPAAAPLEVPFKATGAGDDWFDHFSFKPVANYSGDSAAHVGEGLNPHELNFDAVISSTRTPSQTVTQDDGQGRVHVDSVADLAQAASALDQADRAHGRDQSYGEDGPYVSEAIVNDKGWSTQSSGGEQQVAVNFTITASFGDMDGSESGHILIKLPEGFAIPNGADGQPLYASQVEGEGANQVTWLRIDVGQLNAANGSLTVDQNGNGVFSAPIKLLVSANSDGSRVEESLEIQVVTTEGQALSDVDNNVAVRHITQDVTVDHFQGELVVKAGWGYEDNNGNQFGGQARGAQDAAYNEARADAIGVPVQIAFDADGSHESLHQISFYIESGRLTNSAGRDYPIQDGKVTFTADQLKNGLDLRYIPAEDNKDNDIPLRYEAQVSDPGGTIFTVSGGVTVVIDAVADIGRVSSVDIDADHTAVTGGVYEKDMSVTLTVKAAFTDVDGSEDHYVLVEKPAGWECTNPGAEVIKVFYDAKGNVLQPTALFDEGGRFTGYDYQNSPTGTASSKDFFRIDVTAQDSKDGTNVDYTVTLKPAEGTNLSGAGDLKLATGTMSVEKDFSGSEYDYSNNHAYDLSGVGNLNLMDSYLTRSVQHAYEDHRQNQHLGSNTPDNKGGWLEVKIGNDDSGKFKAGDGGEYLDNDGTVVITFTFVPSETGATPGSFTFSAGGKSFTYSLEQCPTGGSFTSLGNNQYQLNIPARQFSNGKDDLSSFKIRYNADGNDDSDLSGLRVAVPVESADTGFTSTLTTESVNLIVDAAADKPLSLAAGDTVYDSSHLKPGGYAEADWGSKVEITVNSKFLDLDGSERHYIVIEARDGWTCSNAEGTVEYNGVTYFYKDVTTEASENNGNASFKFELRAPDKDDESAVDHDAIAADGSVDLAAGGMAIEGSIIKEGGVSRIDYGNLKTTGDETNPANELSFDNNVAVTTDPVTVNFDVINESSGYGNSVFEDGNRNKHGGNLTDSTYGHIRGNVGISLDDSAGGDKIISGTDEQPNCITFTYTGSADSLGCFSYQDSSGNTQYVQPVYDASTGKYMVLIPDAAIQGDDKSIAMKYCPQIAAVTDGDEVRFVEAVRYEAKDLRDVDYHLNVASDSSKATDYISGQLNAYSSTHPGRIIVDAVADQAQFSKDADGKEIGGVEADYAGNQSAAQSGQLVDVEIKDIQFFDYTDGSEAHYLIVQNRNIGYTNDNNESGTDNFGALGGQTIYITGTDAEGRTVTQTVDIDSVGRKVTITITDGDGVSKSAVSGLTYDQVIGSVKNALGLGDDTFARIPVLNEFLRLTEDGTVSTTVKVTVPEGQQDVDTTYNIKAGAYVKDSEQGGAGLTDSNNTASTLKTIEVDVKVVTSDFDIEMGANRVYENGMPEAFRDGEHAGQVGGYAYSYDGGVATGSEFKPLFDSAGKVIADNLPYAGAEMKLSGLDAGETASITMNLSMGADGGGEAVVNAGNWGTFYDAAGNALAVTAVYDEATGNITLTFNVKGLTDGGEQSIYFVPGKNYSSDDVNIDWKATVTDDASGASKTFNEQEFNEQGGAMTVVVDAVAQAAESTLTVGGPENARVDENGETTFYVESKQNFDLQIKAEFADNDGSETHYFLVEITADTSLNANFTAALKAAGCDLNSGQNRYYQFANEGDSTPVAVYYRIPVDVMKALADSNPTYEDNIVFGENGAVTITVPMSMDGGTTSVRTGTMAVEADSSQMGSYFEGDHRVNENMNLSKVNDVSVDINGPAKITLSQASGDVSHKKVVAYEGDNKDANKGDSELEGGVKLNPSISLGKNAVEETDIFVVKQDGAWVETDTPVTVSWADDTAGKVFMADGTEVKSGDALTVAQAEGLVFVPTAGSVSDADVQITYKLAAVQDTLSGHVKGAQSYVQDVVIDAVAQMPEKITCLTQGSSVTHGSDNVPFQFQVTFSDVDDGSSVHFGLVEYKAGWQLQLDSGALADVIVAQDGKQYFKIPVDSDTLTEGVATTISGTLIAPGYLASKQDVTLTDSKGNEASHSLPGNTGNFAIGAVSVDNAGGGEEATWHNNSAINTTGVLEVDYKFDGGGGGDDFWIRAFENDRPLANEGNDATMGGATFKLGTEQVDVTCTIDPSKGRLTVDGDNIGCDAEGNYRFTYNPDSTYAFVPADNYSDADLDVAFTISGEGDTSSSVNMHVLIDAVAQMPDLGGVTYHLLNDDNGEPYKAYEAGKPLSFTINAGFEDNNDGSEGHYILVLKEAGWQCSNPGVTVVYYDSQDGNGTRAYFKIQAEPDGGTTINMIPPAGSGEGAVGGVSTHHLTYMAMAVEEDFSGSEFVSSNNVAVTKPGAIDIMVSEVNTSASVSLDATNNRILESDGSTTVTGEIAIKLGAHDKVDGLRVGVTDGKGDLELIYNGVKIVVEDDGSIKLANNPDLEAALKNNGDTAETITIQVAYKPEAYDSQDVNISVKVDASDMYSGAKTELGGAQKLEIDGLAWQAKNVESEADYGEGASAAQVGSMVDVTVAASFENTGGTEQHYLLIESKANWDYPDGLAKTYDARGTEFLMIPVDEYIKDFLAGDGSPLTVQVDAGTGNPADNFTFTVSSGGKGLVKVSADFEVKLPDLQLRGDETYVLKTGGLSVNNPVVDDYNSIANDVVFNTSGELNIEVGVVDKTTTVRDVNTGVAEQGNDDPAAAAISFATNNADDSNDVVVGVQITLPEGFTGEIKYLGETVTPVDGVITLPPAGSEAPFSPNGVTYVAPDYWSGNQTLSFTATVADSASGATSAENAYKGNINIRVNPQATEPVSVAVEGPTPLGEYTAFEANTPVSFEVTAVFPDWDGSEQHFVLVEARPGWGNPQNYDEVRNPADGPDGPLYFKVPVGDAQYTAGEGGGSVTVTVNLTTPDSATDESYSLTVGALAVEGGQQAWSGAQTTVTINVNEVQATTDSLSLTAPDTTENVSGAENANASVLTFSLESPGESLVSISLQLPDSGGQVVDSDGNALPVSNGVVVLDGALAQSGEYSFIPAAYVSGELELNYTATVRDDASGATENITGEALVVSVQAVTNAPEDVTGSAQAPELQAGHVAQMNFNLVADFVDNDGSEAHYFLVTLPAGTYPASHSGWGEPLEAGDPLLVNSGFDEYQGAVYKIAASANGTVSLAVYVEAGYDAESAGGIRYEAGSYEQALYSPQDPGKTADFGAAIKTVAGAEIAIDTQGLVFNLDPVVGDSTATLGDFLRNAQAGASGKLDFSDPDGDPLAVSQEGALFTGQDGQPTSPNTDFDGEKGILSVEGDYGVLHINIYTGDYNYELTSTPPANAQVTESFQLNVTETGHGDISATLANAVKSGNITITLEGANAAPRAEAIVENMGSVNEADLEPVRGHFVFTDTDAGDADRVVITEVRAGGSGTADFDPESGLFEIQGDFGKLLIDPQGNYTYTQYNESQTGTENFTVSFTDPFGGTSSSTLTVNTAAVNHGPVAQDAVHTGATLATVDNSFISGNLALAAMDIDGGDSPIVSAVSIGGGEPQLVPSSGKLVVEGEHGTLHIYADGEYRYQCHDGADNNTWDSFTYTIKDSGGLDSSASLHIGIGEPDPEAINLDVKLVDELGHDGDFNLGALDGGNQGYSLFAYDGNDTISGSAGSDTIYAGAGDDVIYAGGAEGTTTTVYGGGGDDLIYAGQGNDVFYGGSGDDTFVWNTAENFGGQDLVADFSNSAFGGTDNDQLRISFADLFGDTDLTSSQVIGSMTQGEGDNTFSYSQGEASFSATFEGDHSILLTMQNTSGQSQTITVQSADAFYTQDSGASLDATAAQAILEQIIKDGTS